MTHIEFQNLSSLEKARALNSFGIFLTERRVGSDRIYLYAINYFYIELLHVSSTMHDREMMVFRVFDDAKYLGAYAESAPFQEAPLEEGC